MQFTVEMPDQIARRWGETPDAIGRRVMEAAAIEGYRAGRLTQRQVGAMLGLEYWQTEAFLNELAVPLNYSAADLAADNATLGKTSRRSCRDQVRQKNR
ncbi:MAG: UPF0175 family protein [Verrucomicrobiia bacterium]